ncbi:MAG: protein kinase domain-containing protein [Egibacteraceae bacterium]
MGIDAIRTLGLPGLLHIAPIGGSSTLYRARQLSKDRAVALRFLDWDADAAGRQCSDSLVRALQTLSQHPHVVTVYGSGQVANGPTYLLLELLEEGSLGEWVAADGRLPCAEVLEVAVKIGGALETAHCAGVAHGRLRADNILVSPSGEPQLAGLDRAVFRHVQALMNGTLPASVDDDLTGLASTMFTLLTTIEAPDGQVKDVLERCEVPAPVRGLIERCLARDHAFCPTSIRDLTAAIQQVQQVLGLAVTDSVVDERAAEDACQALHEATVPPPAEPEPTEPESEEKEPEPELEALEPEPELEPEAAAPELWSAFTPSEPEPEPLTALASPEPWPETVPPEPEPWPALVAPARLAYQRRRRLVIAAALALLAAVAVLVAAQLLRSRRAPSAADQAPPAVVVEQPASNRDAIYTGFRTLTDESGQLSMIVPEEWSAVRSSVWIINGKTVGNRLEAALEGPAAEPWSRPFAVLAASQTLGSTRTVDQVLDQLRILPGECTYVGRRPFNDNLYAGAIDAYTGCGQPRARIETLVAASKKPSHLVMVQVARVAPRDENARDRVMETFQVSG